MTMKEIIQGKVKTVYEYNNNPAQCLVTFHDRVTAGNGEKEDHPHGKGAINCKISSILFKRLEESGIRTHWIESLTNDTMRCRRLTIIPLEVICRNIAAGSIVKTTTITEGTLINPPIIEFFLKDDSKNDPLLTADRVRLMGIDTKPIIERALEVNHHLQSLFTLCGMDLVDFKLEFGYDAHGELFLADELSPDNMRLWKKGSKERFDKDLFRDEHYVGEGDILPQYKEILSKLEGLYYAPYT